jgi:haloalkane dehalogenase
MPDVKALGSTMYYQEAGGGTSFVFLHGNPASSYLWREVLPRVGPGRLLAPDLIGMGRSGKPDIAYSFDDHARYLDAWFDAVGLDRVVLVGHDWGGALSFDWAARHPERVLGIAFLESIVKPMGWDELSPQARARTEAVRGEAGEELFLDQDLLVRQAFTGGVLTPVSDEDLSVYLAPYPTRESRRPLLAWARQLPIGGEPAGLIPRIEAYDAWLAASPRVPKLMMTFEGSPTLLSAATADWCASHVAALEIVHCGKAGHRPAEIAAAVSAWAGRHALR